MSFGDLEKGYGGYSSASSSAAQPYALSGKIYSEHARAVFFSFEEEEEGGKISHEASR